MEPKLQRRVQRYGWDLAVDDYEPLWSTQLAVAQAALLDAAQLAPGDRVLDVACGTGLVSFPAARLIGAEGEVLGVDISGQMTAAAERRAKEMGLANARFQRMDAEELDLPDASFDVALCALGLMYVPEPEQAIGEMRRVLKPGGRISLAVWGERKNCGWAGVFPIVDAEVTSDVCPLFFRLGTGQTLADMCAQAGFIDVAPRRISAELIYADGEEACDAAFAGGPVALAWSRFDAEVRARTRARYLESIAEWRTPEGYAIPGEFIVVSARLPAQP